uniref:RHS repeat domain-containing protein n=1 Tax=uncultured Psychrobacter sp. TaxID=259303 RepID=UPI002593C633
QYQDNNIVKTLTEYHYDAFGRRIAKHSETRNFIQSKDQLTQSRQTQYQHTHMLWDSDLPIQEYSDTHVYTTIYDQGSFKPVARLAWLRDELLKAANDEIKNAKREFWEDAPELIPNMQVFYYHNDQLGTPNELTNDEGEVVWLADYEAWGNTAKVIYSESELEELKVSKEHLQPIRFQGQHFDTETGLHYNRFRYYDPDMGMFTTRDPIGLRGGDNVFAYAPNPTGFIDPLGLEKGPYGLGGGPYSQHNTIKRNKIDWGVSKSISNWRKNPHGPFGGICGAEGTTAATWVPDAVWTNECAEHDRCYSDCSKTKYQCDGAFFRSGAPLQSIALQTVFKKDSTKAYKDAQSKAGCCNDCIK